MLTMYECRSGVFDVFGLDRKRREVLYLRGIFCFAVVLEEGFDGDVEFGLRDFVALFC